MLAPAGGCCVRARRDNLMSDGHLSDDEREILRYLAQRAYRLEPFVPLQELSAQSQLGERELQTAIGRLAAVDYIEQTHDVADSMFITAEGWQCLDRLGWQQGTREPH